MTSHLGLPGNERVPVIWDFHGYNQENPRQTGFSKDTELFPIIDCPVVHGLI